MKITNKIITRKSKQLRKDITENFKICPEKFQQIISWDFSFQTKVTFETLFEEMAESPKFSLSEVVDLFVKFHNQIKSDGENAKAELELEIASRSKSNSATVPCF